ncbi:UvrD-helicase domain-containing protein [Marinobacterium rhizophilum]|uniref:DNA 3'-5' helicase n=1 Tax=Marinobacterium rhizophilum TaxID=420402 RepID=A0ABY5HKQ1_9GAMM|nr:UvrD-helicase domain-containing protein [Marinobacterium rhizophilum]UTW12973.1 UvrD-helicase domain-containing protein [Marinobacterium rhizophilum]
MTTRPEGLLVRLRDSSTRLITWSVLAARPCLQSGSLFHRLAPTDRPGTPGASESRPPAMPELGWIGRWHRTFWRTFSQQLHRQHETDFAQQLQRIEDAVRRSYVRSSDWPQLQAQAAALLARTDATLAQAPAQPDIHCQRLRRIASGDPQLLQRYREHYFKTQQDRHRTLFERIERLPLTPDQQRACITLDDNNLVLAGAGSGKTSTLIGRTAYLIASAQAEPQTILLLAFGRQAASEMQQRLKSRLGIELDTMTFHALGQRIIASVEGRRPRISPLADDETQLGHWMCREFESLLDLPEYRRQVLDYLLCLRHASDSPFDFASEGDYQRFVHGLNLRTLEDETVHSSAACVIADWLWSQGIAYRYRGEGPGAEVYLPAQDICIDLLWLDPQQATPAWLDADHYWQRLEVRRNAAADNGQRRIELYLYQQHDGSLLETLARKLGEYRLVPEPRPDEERLARVRERGLLQPLCAHLAQLLRCCRMMQHDAAQLRARIDASDEPLRLEQALALLQPLHDAYRRLLQSSDEIDFDDMIARALDYVEQGRFASPWQHILVDEFQDMSNVRARLVRALRDAVPGASLFGVGDDWQSIYRFAGSDVGLTTGFGDFFGKATVTALEQTFRFNSSIGDVASRFVLRNKAQLPKQLHSQTEVSAPAISLLVHRSREPAADPAVLERTLEAVSQRSTQQQGASVLIMARNRFSLPDKPRLAQLRQRFDQLQLECRTLHAAKGREADFAIILGLESGKYGFPAARSQDPLLDALLPGGETFPHAEERRLFYVALTRARHRVYLLYNGARPSAFVTELLTEPQRIECGEFEDAG